MSIIEVLTYVVLCDMCGRRRIWESSREEAIEDAEHHGWDFFENDRAVCPGCTPEEEEDANATQ